uniref:Uncharacterized protein n=1 Tax=Magallana gigas TaxID=29159 RepID=A0A8W8L120_MAGGI
MESELDDFLRQLVNDEIIHKMKEQKIILAVLARMNDKDIAEFLPRIGDKNQDDYPSIIPYDLKDEGDGGDSAVDDPNSSGGEELPDHPQLTDVHVEEVPEMQQSAPKIH